MKAEARTRWLKDALKNTPIDLDMIRTVAKFQDLSLSLGKLMSNFQKQMLPLEMERGA